MSLLAAFPSQSGDQGTVAVDAQGNVYGTTVKGGANGDGMVYKIAAGTNTVTTIASFDGTNTGSTPTGGLTVDSHGNIYGSTSTGGPAGGGTVFEIPAGTSTITNLAVGSSYGSMATNFTMDAQGNLYGSFEEPGGSTLYKIAAGTGNLSYVGTTAAVGVGLDLAVDSNGNIYGTTKSGGADNDGYAFKYNPSTHQLTTLGSFTAFDGSNSGLVMDSKGNLYGATYLEGGANNAGYVFEIAANSTTMTTLASLNEATTGGDVFGGLTLDSQGNLFGLSYSGGVGGGGTIFELAAGSSTLSVIASLDGPGNPNTGGGNNGGLAVDGNGDFYGASLLGGPNGGGSVWEASPTTAVPEPTSIVALGQAIALLGGVAMVIARSRSRSRQA